MLRDALGASPGVLFRVFKAARTLFLRSGRVFLGLPIVSEAVCGVAEMIRHGFTVCLDICGSNPRAPLSVADCIDLLFGVGGSGRSPVESADPARGPAWGAGALPAYDPLGSEKYGLEE